MRSVIAYVVSGTVAASAVTPVNTPTQTAGPAIAIGGGAQSIAITPDSRTVYVPCSTLSRRSEQPPIRPDRRYRSETNRLRWL